MVCIGAVTVHRHRKESQHRGRDLGVRVES
jgi:hypothetical protein